MDFKSATDRLLQSLTVSDIADAAGLEPNTIYRARLDPSTSSYRRSPSNWREILINLARERGGELEGLADELESQP